MTAYNLLTLPSIMPQSSNFPAAKGGKTRTKRDISTTKPDIDRTSCDKTASGSTLKCHEMSPFVVY